MFCNVNTEYAHSLYVQEDIAKICRYKHNIFVIKNKNYVVMYERSGIESHHPVESAQKYRRKDMVIMTVPMWYPDLPILVPLQ
jgi:hypothetical protein